MADTDKIPTANNSVDNGPTEEKKKSWKLVRTVAENEDITSVYISPPEDSEMAKAVREKMKSRKPGQFASIRVMTGDGWSEPHPFTITCSPGEEDIRFTIKKHGDFTSSLRDLEEGTPVKCEGPFGFFCADIDQHEDVVMIAGGVGITPFLAVLRDFQAREMKTRITLIWSNRTLSDAFAATELEQMTRNLDLHVVHCITRDTVPESTNPRICFHQGRFGRNVLEKFAPNPNAGFYLCGPPSMQDAVLEDLSSCGIAPDRVQKEAFVFKNK